MLYWDILDQPRKKILKKLDFIKKKHIYLAGGTALALFLGHRTSLDFDFYSQEKFLPEVILKEFKDEFKKDLSIKRQAPDTLLLTVNQIDCSLFYYPYKLVKSLQKTDYFYLASIDDIAAMKAIAIVQRGTKRDFIDIYYLIRDKGLPYLLDVVQKKYPEYDPYLILKSLIFFKDADADVSERGIKILDKTIPSWTKLKRFIEQEVYAYQRKFL